MIRSILHPDNAGVLQEAASGTLLIALDFDGSLAPITARPEAAMMRPRTRRLLAMVSQRYPTAIVSGRAVSDLGPRVDGAQLVGVVGNHGREWAGREPIGRSVVRAWSEELAVVLGAHAGVFVEDKGATLSVHWRSAPDHRDARDTVLQAAQQLLPRPRLVGGKAVLNVMPDDGIDKGSAVVRLMQETGASRALYVGDDDTDEDVFVLPPSQGIIGVHVGRMLTSAATYRLPSQRHVDALLHRLLALRDASA